MTILAVGSSAIEAVGSSAIETDEARQSSAVRSEKRLVDALGAAEVVGIWDGDMIAGVVYGDDNFARIYGLDPAAAAQGMPRGNYAKYVHPDDLPSVTRAMERLVAGGAYFADEHRIIQPDGSLRWVLARGRAIRDADGKLTRFAGISVDITERKRAETRQVFLLDLADRLRALTDPRDVVDTAVTLLGTFLGVNRVGYARVQPDDLSIELQPGYSIGVPSNAGVYPMAVFGAANIARHRQGQTIVQHDVAADPAGMPPIFTTMATRAFVSVPLTRDGRLCATLYASQREPRRWAPDEVALIEEVAARIWDAGERVRAEAALRASEAQFRTFAQAIPNHVWAARADGQLDWFNDRVFEYAGVAPGALDGDAWTLLVHPSDLPAIAARWSACVASGDTYEAEFRVRRRDGVYRWHIVRALPIKGPDGAITRWIGTSTDMDDQKTVAEALAHLNDTLELQVEERIRAARVAEARFRGIFDSTYQLISLVAPDSTVLEVNRAALDAGRTDASQVIGRPTWDAPWFRATEAAVTTLKTAFPAAAAGSFIRRELDLKLPDGRVRTYDFSLSPVRDDRNQVVFIVVEGRDITERKQLEEQLRQSQKMEAVGQLTGGLAHDFNNLLTGIMGSLELVRTRLSRGRMDDLDRYMKSALAAAERAAALTHRLLAFSRQQTLDPRATNINRLVDGMDELVRRTVGPETRVQVDTAPELWNTMVDPHQLENALLNLCINSRHAMPDGGILTVATANRRLGAPAAHDLDLSPGDYVCLSVTDTGTGMPPEVIARAFDPFFTTKPIGVGTGLGLSMIYGFVRQSGGQAHIESAPGRGTTVCLYLPRHHGEAQADTVAAATGPAVPAGDGRIVLVVDDEPSVRMLIADVLEELGYTTIEASDGPAALAVLRSDRPIELLITDVGLPSGMNGRQLADAARLGRPALKVLLITGYAETAIVRSGHLLDGMQVLTKPFAIEGLARTITAMLAKA